MNKKDRGMIKWLPFNSLINNKEMLYTLALEKEKVCRPILSQDEITKIENKIIDAYYLKYFVIITYYKAGYIYKEKGIIKKIDNISKFVYLNNLKLLFNQIIGVTDTK